LEKASLTLMPRAEVRQTT